VTHGLEVAHIRATPQLPGCAARCYRQAMVRLASLVLVATLLAPLAAHAYLLPTEFLIAQMAERRSKMEVRDITVMLTAEIDGEDQPVEERIYLKDPERMRLERQKDEEAAAVYIEREGRRAQGDASAVKLLKGPSTEMLAALLMPRGANIDAMRDRTMANLAALGIDTKTVSITIHGSDARDTAYVIGAKPWETDKPQIWLDSNSFLPIRLISFVDRVKHETRFLDYGSAGTGDWFPRVIENYRGGELVRRAEVSDIKVNQDLPETLFQLPAS
jgi:outer membrane lipoprotein-sorting protein